MPFATNAPIKGSKRVPTDASNQFWMQATHHRRVSRRTEQHFTVHSPRKWRGHKLRRVHCVQNHACNEALPNTCEPPLVDEPSIRAKRVPNTTVTRIIVSPCSRSLALPVRIDTLMPFIHLVGFHQPSSLSTARLSCSDDVVRMFARDEAHVSWDVRARWWTECATLDRLLATAAPHVDLTSCHSVGILESGAINVLRCLPRNVARVAR